MSAIEDGLWLLLLLLAVSVVLLVLVGFGSEISSINLVSFNEKSIGSASVGTGVGTGLLFSLGV